MILRKRIPRLERLGLITRAADPHDSRSHPLVLTDEGERRLEHARAGRQEYMRRSLDAWRPDELAHLADALTASAVVKKGPLLYRRR